ncbi:MAG: hypothetical protein PVF34_10645, partial [Gammaproteobacteria bacterium]
MANIDSLAEKHILAHESRLRHIDEALEKVQKETGENDTTDKGEAARELAGYRVDLANYIDELKHKAPMDWMEEGGPMIVWDIMAERIEELVERIE